MGCKLGYMNLSNAIEATLRCDKCLVKIYKFIMPDDGKPNVDWSEFNNNCVCGNELFRVIDGKKVPLITDGSFDDIAKEEELKFKVDDLYDMWDGGGE